MKGNKKKASTSRKKDDSGKEMFTRSNNTVEAKFTLTAYTLTGGVTNENVDEQHAQNN